MTDIIPFTFEGASVRIIDRDGEPWFVGKDGAEVLGYSDTDYAIRTHCKAAETCAEDSSGQVRHIKVIPERDLYRLIMRSKLPSAEKFEEWVTGEVLPTIRKTGGYGRQRDPIEVLNDPVAMRGLLLTYSEKVLALEARNAELAPKAEALDRIATISDGSMCVQAAAKALQVRPKALFSYLREHGWIYRRPGGKANLGYQPKLTAGLLEHKVTTVLRADGSEKIVEQVLVTAKGLAKLAALLKPVVTEAA